MTCEDITIETNVHNVHKKILQILSTLMLVFSRYDRYVLSTLIISHDGINLYYFMDTLYYN
jgi:hypothetical protein